MTCVLVVDDDFAFCQALNGSFSKRGHDVRVAHDGMQALAVAEVFNPEWVLLDLKMPGASGLELIPPLLTLDPATKIVVLTGYATINTAVAAIKLGAMYYLSKPVSTDDIIAAFHQQEGDPKTPIAAHTVTLDVAERDYIVSVFERNHRNVSLTARELGMHRRTLQRKLDKLRIY